MARRLRLLVPAAALAFLVTGPAVSAAETATAAIPVDQQASLVTSPINPYFSDGTSMHVAASFGRETARSYVHLALGYLPERAKPTGAVLTLHQTPDSGVPDTSLPQIYNANPELAHVRACVLTEPLPNNVTEANAPAYDCKAGEAEVLRGPEGVWTADLTPLVPYWRANGNTGAALVPVMATPGDTWSVSWYVSQTTALAVHTLRAKADKPGDKKKDSRRDDTPTSGVGSGSGGSGSVGGGVVSGPVGGSISEPDFQPEPAVAPTTAPVTPTGVIPVAQSIEGSSGVTDFWPLILLGSLLVAAVAIISAHRQAALTLAARILTPTVAAFRSNPRAYSVATVAVVWGLVFSGYAMVVSPDENDATQLAQSVPGTTQDGTVPGTTPGAGAGPGVAGPGTTGVTGPGTGPGGTNGVTPGTDPTQDPTKKEFTGKGTWRTISGVRVFFPRNGGVPTADLFEGADNTIGITSNQITLCAHAALTYGAAFDIGADDLNVFWEDINAKGGIYGRKFNVSYVNDNYDPGTAVQAANTCRQRGTFFLLGGIGFDQIPAVRQWAEQNKQLYLHHIATTNGSAGLRYSFTSLPSVEDMGRWNAELAIKEFKGKKIGVLFRQSPNWDPGSKTFIDRVKAAGMEVVASYGVQYNQANYLTELNQLRQRGAEVVFAWENGLATVEIIKQAQAQRWFPTWMINPFNLITQTLGNSAMRQPIYGVALWDAYDPGYYGGGFASYAKYIKQFEAMYAKYDPEANLEGPGGDLLFLNWEAQVGMAQMFRDCGPDCTRNKIVGMMLAGYHKTVPPNCPVDFRRGDHHHGGYVTNALKVIRDPNGRENFAPIARCVTSLL